MINQVLPNALGLQTLLSLNSEKYNFQNPRAAILIMISSVKVYFLILNFTDYNYAVAGEFTQLQLTNNPVSWQNRKISVALLFSQCFFFFNRERDFQYIISKHSLEVSFI